MTDKKDGLCILLPEGFRALEPFVDRFAVSGTAQRARVRSESTPAERRTFYDAASALIGPALDLLDKAPLDQLDDKEKRLLDLALTFAHIALATEMQGPDELRHAVMRARMRITRSPGEAVT